MNAITVRDLRNRSADLLRRVAHGERVTVTKDGDPVAEVIPLRRAPLNAEQLVSRFRYLPRVDAAKFREDVDSALDPSL